MTSDDWQESLRQWRQETEERRRRDSRHSG